jgi:DNA-directed RNA polymerase specialized sigma24 family protein
VCASNQVHSFSGVARTTSGVARHVDLPSSDSLRSSIESVPSAWARKSSNTSSSASLVLGTVTIADEDPFPYSDSLHLDFLRSFGREDVHEVLMRMPDLYRVPLVLRYMQGFATKEIATMLDAPLGTVLARLHRGRKLFERELWAYARDTDLLQEGESG